MKRAGMMAVFVSAGMLAAAAEAEACGGCFAPPAVVQVVTDHRMVLSLSRERTTLWDQIRYTGRPSDFSWILPIRNGPNVRIELGDNRFVTALDSLTAPVVTPPQRPFPRFCPRDGLFGAGTSESPRSDAGVQVLQESVVGPYMTVTLRGEDPAALRTWLRDNGYAVPAATQPVLDYYVGQRMDFVALKLRPGEGTDRMQPVRLTLPGYNPTLPLRMIAAGVADKVGLLLLVVANARMEAMNFPNGEVREADLSYDFDRPSSPAEDFRQVFERLNRASGNRLWVTESAEPVNRYTVLDAQPFGQSELREDVGAAFDALGENATVTRLRADLSALALDRDLTLAASDRGVRSRQYSYGRVLNRPADPPPCDEFTPGFFACAATPSAGASGGALAGVFVAFVALAARRRRRAA